MKKTVLSLIKRTCYALGLLHLYLVVERKLGWKQAVISLCYHSIPEKQPADAISILEGGTVRHQFESQMQVLSRWLQPIDDNTLLDWLNNRTEFEGDGLLVTFDDGYKNNQTVALPILEQYQIPGLIFIPTDAITTRSTFWWARLSNLFRSITPSAWKNLAQQQLPQPVLEIIATESLDSWESRKRARRELARWIDRQEDVEEVMNRLGSAVTPQQLHATPPQMQLLEWKDIQRMQGNLFCFGSHTHTHPRLTALDDNALQEELARGCQELDERLKGPPLSLAYPAGDFDQRTVEFARATGFELAFTTQPGIIDRHSNPLELPRIYLGASKPYEIYFALALISLAKYMPKKLEQRLMKLAR
ncbi:MAG: polysaccharide deacetylase family protein [Mariniblastus sp.]|nr:polysaccharide deacetylase family protein [Mariniblastus sp.]